MTKPKPTSFDDILSADEEAEDISSLPEVDILGETFHVRQGINTFRLALLNNEERAAGALTNLILEAVPEEEQARLLRTLASVRKLELPQLVAVMNRLVEVSAGERPTNSSPASRRTTAKKVVARRSVVT